MSIGIYIHVPFCLRKCPYCDFYSVSFERGVMKKYVNAVCKDIFEHRDKGIEVDTIYFGGGTPSLLFVGHIRRILFTINKCFNVVNPEITIEANPSSVDYERLCKYREAGINRISFGVQSADDRQLEFLGRLHSFDLATEAVYDAQRAGFDNISCDIMLGLAGQTIDLLRDTIDKITALPIQHISAYMLKIEQGTPFDDDKIRRAVADEDLQADMYLYAVKRLEEQGYEQYEISNFAKDKRYSRHNLKYWLGEEYLGFGPAAHSFFDGTRYCYERDLLKYIEDTSGSRVVTESSPSRIQEYIMLSLRLKWGISLDNIRALSGDVLADDIERKARLYRDKGLVNSDGNRISLTAKGFLLSNSIIAEFLEKCDEKS